jgi:transcription initiation factor IIF auxiliary subunit
MPFRFDNYARHIGSRGEYAWFVWQVFMDEAPETLATVRSVEYRLHETFPDPIRTSEDREHRFAIELEGWGEFRILITVYLHDGGEERTEYHLDLKRPWPAEAPSLLGDAEP